MQYVYAKYNPLCYTNVVCSILQTVPYGVLCFTSSYSMLDKLTARWQVNQLIG